MIELSVVIPLYNAEKTIERCLTSINEQMDETVEVIIVDDGSEDAGAEYCQTWVPKDSRFKCISTSNKGSGPARNLGVSMAQGKYIMFADSDDYWLPSIMQTVREAINEGAPDLIVFGAQVRNASGKYMKEILPKQQGYFDDEREVKQFLVDLYSENLGRWPWNKVYKASIIHENEISYPEYRRGQDGMFNLRYYDHVTTLRMIAQPLYCFFAYGSAVKMKWFTVDYFYDISQRHLYYMNLIEKWQLDSEQNLQYGNGVLVSRAVETMIGICCNIATERCEKLSDIRRVIEHDALRGALNDCKPSRVGMKVMKWMMVRKQVEFLYLLCTLYVNFRGLRYNDGEE